jgi:hypothetical protein
LFFTLSDHDFDSVEKLGIPDPFLDDIAQHSFLCWFADDETGIALQILSKVYLCHSLNGILDIRLFTVASLRLRGVFGVSAFALPCFALCHMTSNIL